MKIAKGIVEGIERSDEEGELKRYERIKIKTEEHLWVIYYLRRRVELRDEEDEVRIAKKCVRMTEQLVKNVQDEELSRVLGKWKMKEEIARGRLFEARRRWESENLEPK